jgi:hypothetical protein
MRYRYIILGVTVPLQLLVTAILNVTKTLPVTPNSNFFMKLCNRATVSLPTTGRNLVEISFKRGDDA